MKILNTESGVPVIDYSVSEIANFCCDTPEAKEYRETWFSTQLESLKDMVQSVTGHTRNTLRDTEVSIRNSASRYGYDNDNYSFQGGSAEEIREAYSSYTMNQELVDQTLEITSEISKKVKVPSNRLQMIRASEGQNFQVQQVFNGRTEQAFYRREKLKTNSYSMGKDRVTLVVCNSYNAGTNAADAKWIAISVVATAKAFESVGIQARIVVINPISGNSLFYTCCTIKGYSERVNLNKLLFLTSPFWFRRAGFFVIASSMELIDGEVDWGLGSSVSLDDGTEVVDCVHKDSSVILNIPQCFNRNEVDTFIENLNNQLGN
jgi:hypothetical protein